MTKWLAVLSNYPSTIFQLKEYERGTFSVKREYKKAGVGLQGRSAPYEPYFRSPSPGPAKEDPWLAGSGVSVIQTA